MVMGEGGMNRGKPRVGCFDLCKGEVSTVLAMVDMDWVVLVMVCCFGFGVGLYAVVWVGMGVWY